MTWSRSTRVTVHALVLAGLACAPAQAFALSKLQGIARGTVGYTDNAQSAPDDPTPGTPTKSAGVFMTLSPGIVFASATRSAVHRIGYTYTYDLYFDASEASTSSNQLEYRGFFDLSPRTSLVLGMNIIQSTQYAALTIASPVSARFGALPPGTSSFIAGTADEVLSYELSRGLRVYEGFSVTGVTPVFDTVAPRTFATGGRLGAERTFEVDAVGAEARLDYAIVEGALLPDGSPAGTQPQAIAALLGSWRRDWGRYFSSRVEGGVLRFQRVDTGYGFWAPAGRAALTYVTEKGDAELSYTHSVITNPLLGQTMSIDEVRLRGAVPLDKKAEVVLLGSVGYQRGRLIDDEARRASRVDALIADVGAGWQTTDQLLLGLRVQHFRQMTDTEVPPLPLSFVRNAVMASATFQFPSDEDMPRAYRAPRRVDRSDEIRDTLQPADRGDQPGRGGPGS
jgi:hypothetical protein